MADKTNIEWTDATWNPITGCAIKSPGCVPCYAMVLAGTRLKNHPSRAGLTDKTKAGPVWNGKVRFNAEWLTQPLKWKRPRMIFTCAHADLFYEEVPDEWIDDIFAVMARATQHTFQVLTKRSARMRYYLNARSTVTRIAQKIAEREELDGGMRDVRAIEERLRQRWPLVNVWVGVSTERQKEWDERVPDLAETPAAVRFVSIEPLLGPLDPSKWVHAIDWFIVGGQNGPRPTHPKWVRAIRDALIAAGKLDRFFFKQWGTWVTEDQSPDDIVLPSSAIAPWGKIDKHGNPSGDQTAVYKVGKKAAGRLLDGVEHNGMPFP